MREKGFTLVEILMVIVIIGIAVTFLVLSIGDGRRDQEAHAEIRRIATVLTLASEEALLQGREIGVLFDTEGYRFYTFVFTEEGGYWQPYTEDRLLRERTFPEGFYLSLEVEGQFLSLDPDPKFIVPQVKLWSSGCLTPFILRFESERGDAVWEIWGYDNGAIEFVDVAEFS